MPSARSGPVFYEPAQGTTQGDADAEALQVGVIGEDGAVTRSECINGPFGEFDDHFGPEISVAVCSPCCHRVATRTEIRGHRRKSESQINVVKTIAYDT
jgi:hypothetical protein